MEMEKYFNQEISVPFKEQVRLISSQGRLNRISEIVVSHVSKSAYSDRYEIPDSDVDKIIRIVMENDYYENRALEQIKATEEAKKEKKVLNE